MSNVTTSAIKDYNVSVVKQSGRVGTVRYYTKNGMTYVRAASNSTVTNNRTVAQMLQRLTFASLGALYSTFGEHLHGAFSTKAKNQSDYNAFIMANQGQGLYLTKQEKALGYSIALPVIIASGKLPEVTAVIDGANLVSNLAVGSLDFTTATIADLSAAIVDNNADWTYGDQLTIVILRQNGAFCRPEYVRLKLSATDTALVSTVGTFSVSAGCLAFAVSGDFCAGFIHSQSHGSMSFCQTVASDSMLLIINDYLTDEAFSVASASYGTGKETFLVPTGGGSTTTKVRLVLSASPTDGGTVSGAGSYDKDSQVTISAVANTGYTFLKWSDGSTSATRTLTLSSNLSLTAIFHTA